MRHTRAQYPYSHAQTCRLLRASSPGGSGSELSNGVYHWSGASKLVKTAFSAASRSGTVLPSLMEALIVRTYAFPRSDDARVCINRDHASWLIGLPPDDVYYSAGVNPDDAALPPRAGWRAQDKGVAPAPDVWISGVPPPAEDDNSGPRAETKISAKCGVWMFGRVELRTTDSVCRPPCHSTATCA